MRQQWRMGSGAVSPAWLGAWSMLCSVLGLVYLVIGAEPFNYLSAALLLVIVGGGFAQAQTLFKQLFARIERLEAELAALRRTDPRE